MPLKPSNDFGARTSTSAATRKVHDHFFPAANTGLPLLLTLMPGMPNSRAAQGGREEADFLRGTDPQGRTVLRIDLFGIKEGGTIDGRADRSAAAGVAGAEAGADLSG